MATQEYRIVSGEESEIHDEPHIEGSRITVRDVHSRVEQRGLSPERVADRYNLDIADVYEALAYYHSNPEEMEQVEERHRRAAEEAKKRSSLTPSEN
jgi:uncharacterized protein (DUF433 family)